MVRDIRILGDPVLRVKAELVETLDADIQRLIDDMFETMYAADGVGLAAPQVGVAQRVIVVDVREPEIAPVAVVNPRVVQVSDELDRSEEGCLSIPGLRDIVERPARCTIEGMTRDGAELRIEAEGLLARALQHEVDHLDGILFFDRLTPLKRRMLLKKWQKQEVQKR